MTERTPQTIEPERAQLRRNQVLDAASACFRRLGFHGCSMALLAKESAMSVGHIYHYFENKEAIIDAIVTRDLSDSMDEIDQLRYSEHLHEDMIEGLDKPIDRCLNPENAALQCEILAEAADGNVDLIVLASKPPTFWSRFVAPILPRVVERIVREASCGVFLTRRSGRSCQPRALTSKWRCSTAKAFPAW